MINLALIAVTLIAVLIGVSRPFIPTHALSPAGSYEAFSHLFVGGLYGAGILAAVTAKTKQLPQFLIGLAVALSLAELVVFFAKH